MISQTSFTWPRCRNGYEATEQDGVTVIRPCSNHFEDIRPLELNSALFRQLAGVGEDTGKIVEFANAFGLQRGDPSEKEVIAEWIVAAKKLRYATDKLDAKDIIEVCDIINDMKLSKLSLRLEPQNFREQPVLTVGPDSLIDAIWVQLAHAVSNNLQQRACEYCGIWFSYGPGTGRNAKSRFHDDRCRAKSHYYNDPKKEKNT